jgi:hypothetical protein
MTSFVRTLSYLIGVVYWAYLSIPRFDVERRSSRRYRRALGLTKNIWIGSGCVMLLLLETMPLLAVPLSLALSLLTAFVCYLILDQIQ